MDIVKQLFLFILGGIMYNLVEIFYRQYTHWTMFILGGLCFVLLGLLNECIKWELSIWYQLLIGACIITSLEFLTGCIVNLWLGWNVWDYSNLPFNILGQICPQFFLIWIPIALCAITIDDTIRYFIFKEERPRYNLALSSKIDRQFIVYLFPVRLA